MLLYLPILVWEAWIWKLWFYLQSRCLYFQKDWKNFQVTISIKPDISDHTLLSNRSRPPLLKTKNGEPPTAGELKNTYGFQSILLKKGYNFANFAALEKALHERIWDLGFGRHLHRKKGYCLYLMSFNKTIIVGHSVVSLTTYWNSA